MGASIHDDPGSVHPSPGTGISSEPPDHGNHSCRSGVLHSGRYHHPDSKRDLSAQAEGVKRFRDGQVMQLKSIGSRGGNAPMLHLINLI